MQVDGEACRVNPAIIEISHLNKAPMVTKAKAKSSGGWVKSIGMQCNITLMCDTF